MTILLQPSADSVVGDWTNETGGTTLFSSIAGASPNDATFIRSPNNPVESRCRIKLATPDGDVTAPATLKCRMRWNGSSLGAAAHIYEGGGDSLEGGTLIASLVEADAGEEFFTFDHELTTEQFEAVTDWDDLYIEFEASGFEQGDPHYQIDTFTESGTWTAPLDVELVDFAEGWGAGGGSSYDEGTTTRMSGGGSAYARKANIEVVPETGYAVTVAPASTADNDGGDTSFIDGSTLLVKGGKAGVNGRAGGLASECVGDIAFDGGTGPTSTTSNQGSAAAAGDTSAASGVTPGERQAARALASSGTKCVPGGGGSGFTTPTGGARGEIRIHYRRPVPLGFPPVVSRNWGRTSNAAGEVTSHTILMPPNIAVNNLLLAAVDFHSNPGLTIPGDWTILADIANGTNRKLALLYKFAAGGDSLTITADPARRSAHLTWQIATSGVPTVSTATGSGNPDAPEHTPAAGSGKYLWIAVAGRGTASNVSEVLPPANYGAFNYLNTQNQSSAAFIMAAERFLEASAEDPAAFTATATAWVAATVAVPLVEV